MALIGSNVTYLDLASRLGPDYKVEKAMIELLAQRNYILEDAVVKEGNLPTGHKTTVRTGLPTATWRMLNWGVQPSKSITTQVTDECGMLEAYAEVDKKLADLNDNAAAWRLSEDAAFLESMNQNMAQTMFYGNRAVNPERFTGLAPRFAAGYTDRWANRDKIGSQIINCYPGASGNDQTSIWLVVWGDNTVHMTYPKGTVGGFKQEDLGQVTLLDANGGKYEGYRTHYEWNAGLVVRDWRYVVRIANIDGSAVTADPASANLFDALDDALTMVPDLASGRAVFYCNAKIEGLMRKQARRVASGGLTIDQLTENRAIARFSGVPFKRCDQILNTESPVTFA